MVLSCEEYRYQQHLFALKKLLAENKLEPEEREEIERLIEKLERKLGMEKGNEVSPGFQENCPSFPRVTLLDILLGYLLSILP